jgi:GAF domain-containing protein
MLDRDPQLLSRAMALALSQLMEGKDAIQALQKSFDLIREGTSAAKALLLYVTSEEPVKLLALASAGLSPDEEKACVELRSVPGISPSVIRQAVRERRAVFIPNATARGAAAETSSLTDGNPHSVVCAPIVDAVRNVAIGVVYLQTNGILHALEEEDLAWLAALTGAVGSGFGLFSARRQADSAAAASKNE